MTWIIRTLKFGYGLQASRFACAWPWCLRTIDRFVDVFILVVEREQNSRWLPASIEVELEVTGLFSFIRLPSYHHHHHHHSSSSSSSSSSNETLSLKNPPPGKKLVQSALQIQIFTSSSQIFPFLCLPLRQGNLNPKQNNLPPKQQQQKTKTNINKKHNNHNNENRHTQSSYLMECICQSTEMLQISGHLQSVVERNKDDTEKQQHVLARWTDEAATMVYDWTNPTCGL